MNNLTDIHIMSLQQEFQFLISTFDAKVISLNREICCNLNTLGKHNCAKMNTIGQIMKEDFRMQALLHVLSKLYLDL